MADLTREEAVEAMAAAANNADLDMPPWERLGAGQKFHIRQTHRAALDALLSLLAERGWQVVPVVATEEMYSVEHSPLLVLGAAGNTRVQQWRSGIYAAMLAAAPTPLAEEGADGG